jgi:hypothetical protein
MSMQRFVAPAGLAVALIVAACGPTTSSGAPASGEASPDASVAPSASVETSGAPSASGETSAAPSASVEASASAAASADAGGGDLASRIPATVGDVPLSVTITDGEAYVRANVNRQLAPVLTAINKAPTDVTVATATGSTTGGATLFLDAVQVTGADAEALLTAFQTAAAAVPGSAVETTDIGGKSVVKVTTSSYTLAVYASGDTLFYVQSPDAALVDQAVAALP